MLMNNLDPEVAERPEELVVYGGIGRAARNWDCYDRIVARTARARRRRDAAHPVRQAGRRLPHPYRRAPGADRELEPRRPLVDLGALQRARSQGTDDVRPDDGRLVDLHRQPGHRAGHLRDLRRDGPPALRRQSRGALDPDGGPRRDGRRAAARRHHGGRLDARDRVPAGAHPEAARYALPRRQHHQARRGARAHRAVDARPAAAVGRAARQRRGDRARAAAPRDPAGRGHRPDLGARPGQRLPARGLVGRAVGPPARRGPARGRDGRARLDGEARHGDARVPEAGHPGVRLRQQHPAGRATTRA